MLEALNKNSKGLKKVIGEVGTALLGIGKFLEEGCGRRIGTTIFLNNYKEERNNE